MGRYREAPKDIVQFTAGLTKRLARLERLPRSGSTAIDHGDLTVNGGDISLMDGNFTFVDEDGHTLVIFGDIPAAVVLRRAWIFYRSNGQPAIYLYGTPGNPQFVAVQDNGGNIIVSDDSASGHMLATPYIPFVGVKAADLSAASLQFSTSSTSFQLAHRIHGRQQHPVLEVMMLVFTPAGVTAEIKLTDNANGGIDIAGPSTIPANSFTYAILTGSPRGTWLSSVICDVSIRVSSGAGTVGITFAHAYGKQT